RSLTPKLQWISCCHTHMMMQDAAVRPRVKKTLPTTFSKASVIRNARGPSPTFACAEIESCHSRALMTVSTVRSAPLLYSHRHILGIAGLSPGEITGLLDLSESYVEQNRRADKKDSLLRGRTVINLFFETSTRTRTSFELAAKRLGADVINMSVATSAIKK